MSLTGDFARLNRMIQELGRLQSPAVTLQVAFAAQAALVTEVQLAFREERTPYGEKWAPLMRDRTRNKAASAKSGKSSKGKILRDTGRLANSITGRLDGARAIVGTNTEYARFHQDGTSRMIARPFLFAATRGISEGAAAEIADAGEEILRRTSPLILGAAE